jgi:hypothetical protein
MTCDRCNKTNSEFSTFDVRVSLDEVAQRSRFNGSSWTRRLFKKYLGVLLKDPVTKTVNVCQTCTSRMLRKLDKDK